MKKYIFILFSLLFCACSENEILNTVDSELTPEDSIITVKLNIVGDVQTSETPLSRASTEYSDVMGIIIYNGKSIFASGLFDCWENISLNLKAGNKYDVYCTKISDAKNTLKDHWRSTYSGGKSYYYKTCPPFFPHEMNGTYSKLLLSTYENYNILFYGGIVNAYGENIGMSVSSLRDGQVYYYVAANPNNSDKLTSCAPIERFYGEVTDYTPTVDGVLELPLKRVSFGLKVKVSGITDGSVSVTCKNNYNTFYSNSNITSNIESEGQLFSMYNIYDAWQYADTDYQEPVELSVVWTRGNGIVQDLGTKTAYVKRNVMNIIKVRLSKNDTDVDVDVDPEEGDMGGKEEDLSN